MKKLAIGCAAVLVLGMIVMGGIAAYGYYKFRQVAQSFQAFAQVADLNQHIANKNPFVAPVNGELTDDLVRRFVAVQESVSTKLGKRVEELTAKQNELNRLQQAEHRDASLREAYAAVTDLMKLLLEVRTAQVDAMNATHFSLEEYDWTRQQVYAAAGLSIAQLNLDKLQEAMKKAGSGDVEAPQEATSFAGQVPERNKALVQPYLPKLKDWAPFAFFGL